MKLNNLFVSCVLGLFVSTQVFASEQNPVDFFGVEQAQPFIDLRQAQKTKTVDSCALPCQFGKYCIERYNEEFEPAQKVFVPEKNEVHDVKLQAELKQLARVISFVDNNGQLIQPIDHPKREGFSKLPLANRCLDYDNAKRFLEGLPTVDELIQNPRNLVAQFQATQNAGFYSGMCSVVSSSSVSTAFSGQKPKKRKKAIPVVSSVDTELDQN